MAKSMPLRSKMRYSGITAPNNKKVNGFDLSQFDDTHSWSKPKKNKGR